MSARQSRPELAKGRAEGLLEIGEAASASGVSAKRIRHYEAIGLMPSAQRSLANYRLYSEADLHRLRFIQRARSLGFDMARIRTLLGLWDDPGRSSAEVRREVQAHIDALQAQIHSLQAMQQSLQQLARHCQSDQRPDCPILEELSACAKARTP